MGEEILLDVHLQVAPSISVSEGHQIGLVVCKNLRQKFDHIKDITYHIDAEDDDHAHRQPGAQALPLRSDIIPLLKEKWRNYLDFTGVNIKLHYLNNAVEVEVLISTNGVKNSVNIQDSLSAVLQTSCSDITWLGKIRVWYSEEAAQSSCQSN
jgi:hypothetical protein